MTGTIREHLRSNAFNDLSEEALKMISGKAHITCAKLMILNGGQRRDRTADAGLFRAGLAYQLRL
jgi:hypothetical protein